MSGLSPASITAPKSTVCLYGSATTLDIRETCAAFETVQTPVKTLDYKQGDCDDQVTLLASLLESIGVQTRYKAVGFTPGHFQHVFLEARDDNSGKWIGLDPTERVDMGWQPPNPKAVMIQEIF